MSIGDEEQSARIKKILQCPRCPETFGSKLLWQEHRRIVHSEKQFVCVICGAAFSFSANLREHKSVHTGERPHACKFCGKAFRLKGNLTKHISSQHNKDFTLSENSGSVSDGRSSTHDRDNSSSLSSLENETPQLFQSSEFVGPRATFVGLDNSTTSESSGSSDLSPSHDEGFACEICSKVFGRYSNLYDHRSIHTDETPYICNFCGKACRLRGNLKKHILRHHKTGDEKVEKGDIIVRKETRAPENTGSNIQINHSIEAILDQFSSESETSSTPTSPSQEISKLFSSNDKPADRQRLIYISLGFDFGDSIDLQGYRVVSDYYHRFHSHVPANCLL